MPAVRSSNPSARKDSHGHQTSRHIPYNACRRDNLKNRHPNYHLEHPQENTGSYVHEPSFDMIRKGRQSNSCQPHDYRNRLARRHHHDTPSPYPQQQRIERRRQASIRLIRQQAIREERERLELEKLRTNLHLWREFRRRNLTRTTAAMVVEKSIGWHRLEVLMRFSDFDFDFASASGERAMVPRIDLTDCVMKVFHSDLLDDTKCTICQETRGKAAHKDDIWVRLKDCQHPFHENCLGSWVHSTPRNRSTCPLCRAKILEESREESCTVEELPVRTRRGWRSEESVHRRGKSSGTSVGTL